MKYLFYITFLIFTAIHAQTVKLELSPNQEINYNSLVTYDIIVEKEGKVYSTNSQLKKRKLKWSSFDLKIEGGKLYKKGIIKVNSYNNSKSKGYVDLIINHKLLKKSVSKRIELNFEGIQFVDFSGKSGKKRKNNFQFRLFEHLLNDLIYDKDNVELDPANGKNGRNGAVSGFTTVDLEVISINGIPLLKATCVNKSLQRAEIVFSKLNTGQIKIIADGGRGSSGTSGQRKTRTSKTGGNGGSGGDGKDGGFVEIYVNEQTSPFVRQVIVSAEGGLGGKAGKSFSNSQNNVNGKSGFSGKVMVIDKSKIKNFNLLK